MMAKRPYLLLIFCSLALSGLAQDPELKPNDYPLTVERPRIVQLGEQVTFSCTLGKDLTNLYPNNDCKWKTPDGDFYWSRGSRVYDEANNVISGISAYSDSKTCRLTIEAISESRTGEWQCRLNDATASQFRRGRFSVLTSEQSHVRDIRLPPHIEPVRYEVELTPFLDPDNFTIRGYVKMEFDHIKERHNSNRIYLHIRETAIDEDSVKWSESGTNDVIGHEYDIERNFYVVHLQKKARQGPGWISMTYMANLNDDLTGFYRSSYPDEEDGSTRYLAATQFQKPDARKAFPCMDEPDLKATFRIRLGRREEMIAVSNMPLVANVSDYMSPTLPNGYVMDEFEETVVMSTYILAFLVSDFTREATEDNSDFLLNYVPYKASQARLAGDCGPKMLRYFEGYYDIPYPLPKTDMVALPDFAWGAMENWGLITYRETAMLYEEGVSSLSNRYSVIRIIAHELAHMWFGNLVTCEWWTDLW